jgi:hypothetical protein
MGIDTRELAWAAGPFEGEGCITHKGHKGNPSRYPTLHLVSTDEDTVRRFHAAVDGLGAVSKPYWAPMSTKPVWRWQVCKFEHAQAIVAFLWFGLGERRRARAIEVLSMAEFRDATGVTRRLDGDEEQRVEQLLRDGRRVKEIAAEIGCSRNTIYERRKALGILTDHRRDADRQRDGLPRQQWWGLKKESL